MEAADSYVCDDVCGDGVVALQAAADHLYQAFEVEVNKPDNLHAHSLSKKGS